MKMTRNLIIVGVLAVLAVAMVIIAPKLKPAAPSAAPTSTVDTTQLSIISVTSDTVSEVTVENPEGTYSLVRQGEAIAVKDQVEFSLDQSQASNLFTSVSSITAERLIEENPADLAVYGLDKPQAKAIAKFTDGSSAVFLLGNKTSSGSTYYFMKEGDSKVYTVWTTVGSTLMKKLDTLSVKGAITITSEDIEEIKVVEKGVTTMELTTKAAQSGVAINSWMIVTPWKRYTDSEELDAFITAALAVSMGEVVEADAKDLSAYGLDNPAYDITLSGNGKSDELQFGSAVDETYTYAKFAGSSTVYKVATSSLTFMDTSPYKLMDKMIMLVNISSALGLELKGLGADGKMVIEQKPALDDKGDAKLDGNGNPMYDQIFSIDGNPIEDDLARYYYQICIGLSTHSLVKEGWTPSGEPAAVLTYTRSNEPTTIKIEFMAYDKDFYAVRMDGESYFLIKQEKVQAAADAMVKLKAGELVKPES